MAQAEFDERAFSFVGLNQRDAKPPEAWSNRNPGTVLHPDAEAVPPRHIGNHGFLCGRVKICRRFILAHAAQRRKGADRRADRATIEWDAIITSFVPNRTLA